MADKAKTTIAAGGTLFVSGLPEHGRVRICATNAFSVAQGMEGEATEGAEDWFTVLQSNGGMPVDLGYVGTTLRIKNDSAVTMKVRVGEI